MSMHLWEYSSTYEVVKNLAEKDKCDQYRTQVLVYRAWVDITFEQEPHAWIGQVGKSIDVAQSSILTASDEC